MPAPRAKPPAPSSQAAERRFYARSRAFGRFGMRIFRPEVMVNPHTHGHIEINLVRHARMHYGVDGEPVTIEPDAPVAFWAAVPHQLMSVEPVGAGLSGDAVPELGNIYLPLDAFLFMSHIHKLQVALLTGAMVSLPADCLTFPQMQRWFADYRTGDAARADLVKTELNSLLRRVSLGPMPSVRKSWLETGDATSLGSAHVRHVVAMVRYILDNLEQPMRNADVAAVTGLHTNYALALFSKIMLLPLKQFIIRMRLLRARGLLLESDLAISSVAGACGFLSISQFYAHFSAAYGTSPQQFRRGYHQAPQGL